MNKFEQAEQKIAALESELVTLFGVPSPNLVLKLAIYDVDIDEHPAGLIERLAMEAQAAGLHLGTYQGAVWLVKSHITFFISATIARIKQDGGKS